MTLTPEEAISELEIIKEQIATIECNTSQCKIKRWSTREYQAIQMAEEALKFFQILIYDEHSQYE